MAIPIGSMVLVYYANIWGIWMVNVTIYSIHGSYGIEIVDLPIKNVGANNPLKFSNNPLN